MPYDYDDPELEELAALFDEGGDPSFMDRLGGAFAANPVPMPQANPYTSPFAGFLMGLGSGASNAIGSGYQRKQAQKEKSASTRLALARFGLEKRKGEMAENERRAKEKAAADAEAKRAEAERVKAAEQTPGTPEYDAARKRRFQSKRDELEDQLKAYRSLGLRAPTEDKPDNPEKPEGADDYGDKLATRTIEAVNEAIPMVNVWTAGFLGKPLSMVPGTAAANLRAKLDNVASNIAFNELKEMRQASKTGGALGQISDRENVLLASAEGALQQAQSPEALVRELRKVEASIRRWDAAKKQHGFKPGAESSPSGKSASPDEVEKARQFLRGLNGFR